MSSKQFVQFSDDSETKIIGWFAAPQDSVDYPHMGQIDEDDGRYVAFLESLQPKAWDLALRERDRLLIFASMRIAPLQDATDLDNASTEEVALLQKWKQYRVALNRLDLGAEPVTWPDAPA